MEEENKNKEPDYLTVIAKLINVIIILLFIIVILVVINFCGIGKGKSKEPMVFKDKGSMRSMSAPEQKPKAAWNAPDTVDVNKKPNAELIRYGRELVANTAYYFGPKGKIFHLSNGMNCQNCHLNAGAKPYGNNYGAVASTYPKFRERSGTIETIYKRVNDCFERSLNGKAIDSLSKEMRAIVSYIKWLGKDVPKGEKPLGAGIVEIPYLNRAADPAKGKIVYDLKCKNCHETKGEGKLNDDGLTYRYPPLWGDHSYNIGAGLYRLSRFASYVRNNMPQGASFENQQLSNEEAWDVAAFVNSQPRPKKDLSKDWPKLSAKPVDHPFGPYSDKFSEEQHKYGPFEPIVAVRKK